MNYRDRISLRVLCMVFDKTNKSPGADPDACKTNLTCVMYNQMINIRCRSVAVVAFCSLNMCKDSNNYYVQSNLCVGRGRTTGDSLLIHCSQILLHFIRSDCFVLPQNIRTYYFLLLYICV